MTDHQLDDQPQRRRTFSAAASEPVVWDLLAALFAELIGPEHEDLGGYPARIGWARASWYDIAVDEHKASTLADLRHAIEDGSAHAVEFAAHRADGFDCSFFYAIIHDPPAIRGEVSGPRSLVDQLEPIIDAAFPLPRPYPVLFLSWAGSFSDAVAKTLAPILRRRLPHVEVFFSPDSIAPGDNPTRRMLHDALRRTEALIAVLTDESASRPWVVWETACVGARRRGHPAVRGPGPLRCRGPAHHRGSGSVARRQVVGRLGTSCARRPVPDVRRGALDRRGVR